MHQLEGTDIIYHKMYNIGVAVASPRGLVVPVLKKYSGYVTGRC